jgi:hypothetical protein
MKGKLQLPGFRRVISKVPSLADKHDANNLSNTHIAQAQQLSSNGNTGDGHPGCEVHFSLPTATNGRLKGRRDEFRVEGISAAKAAQQRS